MPPNSPNIADDDVLLRRLSPRSHFKSNGAVTRAAFRVGSEYEHEISVQVQRLLDHPDDPTEILGAARQDWGIGALVVRDVKALGFDVELDPLPNDPAHALIKGKTDQELAERLLDHLRLIKEPTMT